MTDNCFDVAVIGGGPGGYVAAIRASQLGGRVVLFERGVVGGTCLNRGCIPTKTYLKTAEMIRHIQQAPERGVINDTSVSVDMEKVAAYKDRVVRQLTGGVDALLRSNGVKVVKGTAALSGEHSVTCGGETWQAASIILCGGSHSARIPIPGADDPRVLTSTGLLDLRQLPAKLVIIGGGVIGCEMASAFHAFGSQVTIVEAADCLLPMMDRDISEFLTKALEKQGIRLLLGQKVASIQGQQDALSVLCESGESLPADRVLLSIGRSIDLSCLGTMADRIRTDRGRVLADSAMRTNIPHIYAVGDMNGQMMLAHTAFKMGEVAAENAMGGSSTCDLSAVANCVYTIPQGASVGLTEEEAVKRYGREAIRIGRFPLSANGRSLANGETDGFVKVIVLEKYSELCGVHICGAHAADMIDEPAALLAAQVTCEEAAKAIHAHPGLSEAFMEACSDAMGCCIHLPKRR